MIFVPCKRPRSKKLEHEISTHGLQYHTFTKRHRRCNVRGRGSLSHYLVYSESPSRWCSLAIILLIYLHHNLQLVSNRSIRNTYRLVTFAVRTLLSLSCSLERFAFEYHVNLSKTHLPLNSIHDVANHHQYGHAWINYTHQIAIKPFPKTNQQLRAQCSPNRQKHTSTPRSHVVTYKIRSSPHICSKRGVHPNRFETRDTSPITYHRQLDASMRIYVKFAKSQTSSIGLVRG
jgi:hypothetical protein